MVVGFCGQPSGCRPGVVQTCTNQGSKPYNLKEKVVFTALHGMQTPRILSVCRSVSLSVRPSVTRVDCDKTAERSVQIYIPYEKTYSLVI